MSSEQTPAPYLNASQQHVFDNLLAIGMARPVAPDGIAGDLSTYLERVTAEAVEAWTEPSLWISKSQVMTIIRCEGQAIAYRSDSGGGGINHRTAAGIIAHKAIQIAGTFPGRPFRQYVEGAIEVTCEDDEDFATFWQTVSEARRAEMVGMATERVAGFLDSWPPLDERWEPKFEAPLQAKIGRLTLGGRVDLSLGRARPPRQTMLLCDFKTGGIGDEHLLEAGFYALVSTLRYGIPPFRSVIYSLASGEWTEPADVTADWLWEVADIVGRAVNSYVEVLTEARQPEFGPGRHCEWCPAKETCPAADPTAQAKPLIITSSSAAGDLAATAAGKPETAGDREGEEAGELVGVGAGVVERRVVPAPMLTARDGDDGDDVELEEDDTPEISEPDQRQYGRASIEDFGPFTIPD